MPESQLTGELSFSVMIRQVITLKDYLWRIRVYYAVDAYYAEEILSLMEDLGASGIELRKAANAMQSGCSNIGLTCSAPERRETVMVIGRADSPEEFQNTFDHEKGHLVKHICLADRVDPFGEEAEYLAGAIGQRMFRVARRFLCGHCRSELPRHIGEAVEDED